METYLALIRDTLLRADQRGLYTLMSALAALFLLSRRRTAEERGLGLYGAAVLVLFFLPPTAFLATKFMRGGDVYWRFLWLFPTTELLAGAATLLVARTDRKASRAAVTLLLAAALVLGGRNLYTSGAFQKATGREKLSLMTMRTANAIAENMEETGVRYAHLAAPQLVSSEIREVTSEVTLYTGRILNIEPLRRKYWKWYRNLRVLYGAKTDEKHRVVQSLKKQHCNYILMYSRVDCDGDLEDAGYRRILSGEDWNLWFHPDVGERQAE